MIIKSPGHQLRLFSATSIVIANMIGTGVFTSLGFQLADIQDPFAILMLWTVGAVLALCGALVYGELGAAMPRSGGEYHYLSQIYHPSVGFMSGWVSITVGFAAPVALASMAFGTYLNRVLPMVSASVMAVAILLSITLIHCLGFRFGVLFQDVSTLFKIALIALFVLCGYTVTKHAIPVSFLPTRSSVHAVLSPAFAVSLVYVSYSYSGWNASSYIASEIDHPQKKLPQSLWMGTLLVAVLYLLLNSTFLSTAPVQEMKGQIEVAFISGRHVFGLTGGNILAVMISILLISSIGSMVFVGPRITQVMGEDIRLFRVFTKRNRGGIPVYAILFQSAISLILIVSSTFEKVLTFVGFTLNLFTMLTVLGVFVHRKRCPDVPRPYKTWGYPVVPTLFLGFMLWMQIYLILERSVQAIAGLCTVLLGLVFYFINGMTKKNSLRRMN